MSEPSPKRLRIDENLDLDAPVDPINDYAHPIGPINFRETLGAHNVPADLKAAWRNDKKTHTKAWFRKSLKELPLEVKKIILRNTFRTRCLDSKKGRKKGSSKKKRSVSKRKYKRTYKRRTTFRRGSFWGGARRRFYPRRRRSFWFR
nr:hypothetical protein [Crucivirus sp.]